MSLDLLCIAPHPDDAELACGGWLALASERGQRAGIVDLSAGELATNGTVPGRAAEAQQAAAVLGLAHRSCLGLPDGGLDDRDDAQLTAMVTVLRDLRPALLLAPWTEARHPDHAAAGHLARRALFFAGLAKFRPDVGAAYRPARLLHYPLRHEIRADLVVDITSAVERKQQAIAAHVSQVGPGVATAINHPLGLDAWSVRDRYWGASIGVRAGEPYLLGGPVPMCDPVAHFAAHPASPTLVPSR